MSPRPAWHAYFLDIARVVAQRSTCLRIPQGVGALLVRDRQILATGYAGAAKGLPHCTDEGVGCLIDEKTGGCVRTVHAELNTLLQAAQHGVSIAGDTTLYSTLSPCWNCFLAALNAGVKSIYYSVEYRTVERQRTLARESGIWFQHIGDAKYVPGVAS